MTRELDKMFGKRQGGSSALLRYVNRVPSQVRADPFGRVCDEEPGKALDHCEVRPDAHSGFPVA